MIDRILIVDDEFLVRQMLEETASRRNVEVVSAGSGEEAVELLKSQEFQMAFVDLKMGKLSGMDVLRFCNKNSPKTIFVIMTAYGTLDTAIDAMKLGAFDFVIKPFSPDQMDILIEKARLWLQMNERGQYFQNEISTVSPGGFTARTIGESEQMQSVRRLVERVAPTGATVLITGESGTGKELIASEIFKLSDPMGKKPYIRMNCAAVPENLLESELFGHEKGAFTGASERRVGRFELADGGTLLLDEIGEISPNMQSKLLRVLQESEFERVGGSKTIKVDVRIIATTNRNLKEEVKNGSFREDLYYRLNVFPIHLPPLRERNGDAVKIASYFLDIQQKKLGRELRFDDSALDMVKKYPWPGNIRELENVIERIAILEDGPGISAKAFPSDMLDAVHELPETAVQCPQDFPEIFDINVIERETIRRALSKTGGNKTKAAELLGFNVRTLRNKLNEYKEQNVLDEDFLKLISND